MKPLVRKTVQALAAVGLTVLALAATTPALAASDGTWVAKASLPTRLEGMCAAAIGDKIYAAYGFSPLFGDTNLLRIYDISSNTWSMGPPAPLPVRSEAYRGVSHGGKLYCLGGRPVPVVAGNDVVSFDPASGKWTILAPMPDARAGTTSAVLGDSIYVVGGRKGAAPCAGPAVAPGATTTILKYDIAHNAWSNAGNLKVDRSDATVARVGDRLFIFGGCNGPTTFDSVEEYNPHTQTSSLLAATMPGGARSDSAATRSGNLIHVLGGTPIPAGVGFNHLVFDAKTRTFTVASPMPTHCAPGVERGELEVVSHGDRLFAVAGACPFAGTSIDNLDVLKLHP
jgi:hypothetical protein